MANPFDQFDVKEPPANDTPDQQEGASSNPFDQFDAAPDDSSQQQEAPQPQQQSHLDSSGPGAFARQAGEAAIPTVAALPAIGEGIAGGAALGTAIGGPGIGTAIGGAAGGLAAGLGAGYLVSKAQDWVLQQLGLRQGTGLLSNAQQQADLEQHPYWSAAGGVAAGAVAFGGAPGATTAMRGLGAGIFAGQEAGQELYNEGKLDPGKLAISAAGGFAMPDARPWAKAAMGEGRLVSKFVAGRPNVAPDPNAAADQTAVNTNDVTTVAPGVAAENAPVQTNVNIGNGDKGPGTRDGRPNYKADATASGAPTVQMTDDNGIHADLAAALKSGAQATAIKQEPQPPIQTGITPDPAVSGQQAPTADAPVPSWLQANNDEAIAKFKGTPIEKQILDLAKQGKTASEIGKVVGLDHNTVRTLRDNAGIAPAGPMQAFGKEIPRESIAAPAQEQASPKPAEAPPAAPEGDQATIPSAAKPTAYEAAPSTKYSHPDPDFKGITVDHTKQTPGKLAQMTPDGQTVFIDRSVPKTVDINGKPMNPAIPLSLREIVARHTVDRITDMAEAGGVSKPDPAQLHAEAQKAGGHAVNEWLSQNGYDLIETNKALDKMARANKAPVATAAPKTPKVVKVIAEKLKATGNEDMAKQIQAAPAEKQAQLAMRAQTALTGQKPAGEVKNVRVRAEPLKLSNGQIAANKGDLARKQGAIDAGEKTFNDPRFRQLPFEKTNSGAQFGWSDTSPEAQAKLKEFAQQATEDAIKNNGGKHPNDVYKMKEKSPAYMWLERLRNLNKPGGMTPANMQKFYNDHELLRNGGAEEVRNTKKINASIEKEQRPSSEEAAAAKPPEADTSRHEFTPLPEWKPGSDLSKPEIDASNTLRDWINGLSPEDYAKLTEMHEDIAHDVELTQDPEELLRNYQDDMAAYKPRGTPVKSAADLPVQMKRVPGKPLPASEDIKTTGKSLKGTPEFERLKAQYEGTKAPAKKTGDILPPPRDLITEAAPDRGTAGRDEELAAAHAKNDSSAVSRFINDDAGAVVIPEALSRPPSDRFSAATLKTESAKNAAAINDDLHKMDQNTVNDEMAHMKAWPEMKKDLGITDPKQAADAMEKIYLAHESDGIATLPEKLQTWYNKWLKPIFDENGRLYQAAKAIDPRLTDTVSEQHISRMMVGKSPIDERQSSDPVSGARRSLNTTTGPLMDRSFKVISDELGRRAVISKNPDGALVIWNKGEGKPLPAPEGFEFNTGEQFQLGGKTYTVKEANTPEIEANVKDENGQFLKYYKNAALSAMVANVKLKDALRHMVYLDKLTQSDEWKANAQKKQPDIHDPVKGDWRRPVLKQVEDWYMSPEYQQTFDDYAQPGFAGNQGLDWARNLSRQVTKLMFWLPTPHILNVGAHWYVAREWNWLNPIGYKNLAETGIDAIKSVITQDDFQKQLRDAGYGGLSGGIITQKFAQKAGKEFGTMMQKEPGKWDPVVKALGLDTLKDLTDAIYAGSSRVMWAANDMFLTQLIKENMRKGMTMEQAITHAERHIPNYRVPIEIAGSRFMSQLMQDPLFSAFGRYRYGVFNSYAHIVKGLVNGTGAQRKEALGNIMAMGMLGLAVYPVLNKWAQYITGNDNAEQRPRGPLSVPSHLLQFARGHEDLSQVLKGTLTVPPLASTALEAYNNTDWAGRKIVQPGALTGPTDLARRAVQEGEHAVRGLVSPVGSAENAIGRQQTIGESLRNMLIDVKDPSARAVAFERKENRRYTQQANRRFIKPPGVLEEGFNKLFGR